MARTTRNTQRVVGLVCALAAAGAVAAPAPALADGGECVFSHACDLQSFAFDANR